MAQRAALAPLGADDIEDELFDDGVFRLVFSEPIGFELGAFGGIFAFDEGARGKDAMLLRVLAGNGLARSRGWAGMAGIALFHFWLQFGMAAGGRTISQRGKWMKGKADSFLWFFVINEDRDGKRASRGARAGEDAAPPCANCCRLKRRGWVYETNLVGLFLQIAQMPAGSLAVKGPLSRMATFSVHTASPPLPS